MSEKDLFGKLARATSDNVHYTPEYFFYQPKWRNTGDKIGRLNLGLDGSAGSPLTQQGGEQVSTAPMYFTAIPNAAGTQITINYLFFTAWNG